MKKELIISILITICVLVGAFLLIPKPTTLSVPSQTTVQSTSPSTSSSLTNIVTTLEIQKHNTISDCWLILNNKAYDVTSYINQHPGGLTIVPFCGKDGTDAYNLIRGGIGHSNKATQLLQTYYVGDVQ